MLGRFRAGRNLGSKYRGRNSTLPYEEKIRGYADLLSTVRHLKINKRPLIRYVERFRGGWNLGYTSNRRWDCSPGGCTSDGSKIQGSRQSRGSTKAASNLGEAVVRAEQGRRKRPSGCRSRIGVRRAKGSGEQRDPESEGSQRYSKLVNTPNIIEYVIKH